MHIYVNTCKDMSVNECIYKYINRKAAYIYIQSIYPLPICDLLNNIVTIHISLRYQKLVKFIRI